jgi:hypothetical protein
MYFYQQVDKSNYESVVEYLMTRARHNGIDPDVTDDIIIFWDDTETDDEEEDNPSLVGKLYVSQALLQLV